MNRLAFLGLMTLIALGSFPVSGMGPLCDAFLERAKISPPSPGRFLTRKELFLLNKTNAEAYGAPEGAHHSQASHRALLERLSRPIGDAGSRLSETPQALDGRIRHLRNQIEGKQEWTNCGGGCVPLSRTLLKELIPSDGGSIQHRSEGTFAIFSRDPFLGRGVFHEFNVETKNGAETIIVDTTWKQYLKDYSKFSNYPDAFIGTARDLTKIFERDPTQIRPLHGWPHNKSVDVSPRDFVLIIWGL